MAKLHKIDFSITVSFLVPESQLEDFCGHRSMMCDGSCDGSCDLYFLDRLRNYLTRGNTTEQSSELEGTEIVYRDDVEIEDAGK